MKNIVQLNGYPESIYGNCFFQFSGCWWTKRERFIIKYTDGVESFDGYLNHPWWNPLQIFYLENFFIWKWALFHSHVWLYWAEKYFSKKHKLHLEELGSKAKESSDGHRDIQWEKGIIFWGECRADVLYQFLVYLHLELQKPWFSVAASKCQGCNKAFLICNLIINENASLACITKTWLDQKRLCLSFRRYAQIGLDMASAEILGLDGGGMIDVVILESLMTFRGTA